MRPELVTRLSAFATAIVIVNLLLEYQSSHQPSASARAPVIHEVNMVLDGTRYEFRPARLVARPGDLIRFVNVTGGPHNVAFWEDSLPPAVLQALDEAMGGDKLGPGLSPLLIEPGETYEIRIPSLPVGRYAFTCIPHMAMRMRGELIVTDRP